MALGREHSSFIAGLAFAASFAFLTPYPSLSADAFLLATAYGISREETIWFVMASCVAATQLYASRLDMLASVLRLSERCTRVRGT